MRWLGLGALAIVAGAAALWWGRPLPARPTEAPRTVEEPARIDSSPRSWAVVPAPPQGLYQPPVQPPPSVENPPPRIYGLEPETVAKLQEQARQPDPAREAFHERRRREAKEWKAARLRTGQRRPGDQRSFFH